MSSGLEKMKKRISYNGYDLRDSLLVKGKYNSFKDALRISYQAENITFKGKKYRCLINPDKLKENYDQKIISIDYSSNMKNGEVFYWDRTKKYWLVYLQDYSEEAYFRANIRRCDYQIDVNDNKYWIYLRGPVETALVWRQKHQIEMNELNYSIMFYIEKNEETLEFFNRFKVIKFDGNNWRVVTTDKYSQEGIIEVYLEEFYNNEMEDAMVVPAEIKQDTRHPYIDGPQIVRPFDTNITFAIVGLVDGKFVIDSDKVKILESTESKCTLDIVTGKAGSFTITYKSNNGDYDDINLIVNIKSL